MLRRTLLAAAALLLLPALLHAYTVVLKDGRKFNARVRYTVQDGLAKFSDAGGKYYEFPLDQIDQAATETANRGKVGGRLWMNDDVEALRRSSPISVFGSEAAPAAEPAAAEGEAAAEGAAPQKEAKPLPPKENTAEYWQQRLKPLRDEMAQIDQQLSDLRSQLGRSSSNSLSVTSASGGADVTDTIRRLEARRNEVQQQIEAVQAEARRQGFSSSAVR